VDRVWRVGRRVRTHRAHPSPRTGFRPERLLFSPIAGVRYAQPNALMGFDNAILASRQDGGWRLDYQFGWGDCMAGCIDWYAWSFFVAGDLTVTYLGSSGFPLPHGR